MVRTIACLPALVGAWRERGGGILGPTVVGRVQPARPGRARRPAARHARASTWSASGTRSTELEPPVHALVVYNSNPADHRARQHARRAGPGARGPLHRRARALPDRHGPLRRRRAAGHHAGRARRPRALRGATPTSPTTSRPSRRSARRCPTPRSSGAWRGRMGFDDAAFDATDEELARAAVAGARAAAGHRRLRAPARGRGGPRPTCPRTSGRSRRAASGRPPGACGCGRRTCRRASTRRPATASRWRS